MKLKTNIRQETQEDHKEVFELIERAFRHEEYSDHKEQFLVERLRDSEAFIPEFSLVAEIDDNIVGYILLTKIKIRNENQSFNSLALAPVAVLPEFQNRGIGGELIEYAHSKAKELGFKSVVLLGHEKYYPIFGYSQADKFGIELPFDVPKENCMAIELVKNSLKEVSGVVEYPKEFVENESGITVHPGYKSFLLDLVIYISVMFLIREIYIPKVGFIANGLFWSFSTLVIAMWRMKVREVTWQDLGLRKPDNFGKTIGISALILVAVIFSIITFEIIKDHLPFSIAPDTSPESAVSKFGDLKGNWLHFFLIIPFVWIESMLEELLDRGFLMNWIERLFSKTSFATVIAVLLQAAIFGFRHSHDLSARSISVGIIGLIMGIAYVVSGRNLWPLIIAHGVLNTMSMVERVS